MTLVEMVVVIAITGIVAVAVTVFLRGRVEGYVDTARRAELTDIADTALRRISRDLRRALPNSVRVTTVGAATYLEYLQTTGGGRYRADLTSTGTGDPLDFTQADSTFDVIGPMPSDIAKGNLVVVYNLGSGSTDAYSLGNTSDVTDFGTSSITISSKRFPFASPGKRFQTISGPVTYVCDAAAGTLRRISGYAVTDPQPTDLATGPLSTAPVNALLASSVTACSFVYNMVTQRTGTVAMSLEIQQSGEVVRLFQQVNINNVP